MVSYYTCNLFSEKFKQIGGVSMEHVINALELINYVISIITFVICNLRSFTEKQIAVATIILIIVIYVGILIFLYKKNHSYSSKSDPEDK